MGLETFHAMKPKNLAVAYQDPRKMYVTIRTGLLTLDVVVAHAQHLEFQEGHGWNYQQVRDWWEGLERVVAGIWTPGTPLVVLIDASARVGSVTSPHVGSFAPDR